MMNQIKPTWRDNLKALAYLAPMLVIIAVFSLYPIIKSLAMSFYTDYNFFTNQVNAMGFDNFKTLWQDNDFHLAVWNTIIFVIGVVQLKLLFRWLLQCC